MIYGFRKKSRLINPELFEGIVFTLLGGVIIYGVNTQRKCFIRLEMNMEIYKIVLEIVGGIGGIGLLFT